MFNSDPFERPKVDLHTMGPKFNIYVYMFFCIAKRDIGSFSKCRSP